MSQEFQILKQLTEPLDTYLIIEDEIILLLDTLEATCELN